MVDMRTIIVSFITTNVVCTSIMAVLWLQNRKRFAGIDYWLAQYIAITVAVVLLALRGVISDFMSIVVANTLVVACFVLLYMGVQRFVGQPPYFVLIERALRDEGTSYHYLPPAPYSEIKRELLDQVEGAARSFSLPITRGVTWTTDAPFRETEAAIAYARSEGILAVEMEAAALYAFAQAKSQNVICFAHVTNQMGNVENDFEKGVAQGSLDALQVISLAAHSWLNQVGDAARS